MGMDADDVSNAFAEMNMDNPDSDRSGTGFAFGAPAGVSKSKGGKKGAKRASAQQHAGVYANAAQVLPPASASHFPPSVTPSVASATPTVFAGISNLPAAPTPPLAFSIGTSAFRASAVPAPSPLATVAAGLASAAPPPVPSFASVGGPPPVAPSPLEAAAAEIPVFSVGIGSGRGSRPEQQPAKRSTGAGEPGPQAARAADTATTSASAGTGGTNWYPSVGKTATTFVTPLSSGLASVGATDGSGGMGLGINAGPNLVPPSQPPAPGSGTTGTTSSSTSVPAAKKKAPTSGSSIGASGGRHVPDDPLAASLAGLRLSGSIPAPAGSSADVSQPPPPPIAQPAVFAAGIAPPTTPASSGSASDFGFRRGFMAGSTGLFGAAAPAAKVAGGATGGGGGGGAAFSGAAFTFASTAGASGGLGGIGSTAAPSAGRGAEFRSAYRPSAPQPRSAGSSMSPPASAALPSFASVGATAPLAFALGQPPPDDFARPPSPARMPGVAAAAAHAAATQPTQPPAPAAPSATSATTAQGGNGFGFSFGFMNNQLDGLFGPRSTTPAAPTSTGSTPTATAAVPPVLPANAPVPSFASTSAPATSSGANAFTPGTGKARKKGGGGKGSAGSIDPLAASLAAATAPGIGAGASQPPPSTPSSADRPMATDWVGSVTTASVASPPISTAPQYSFSSPSLNSAFGSPLTSQHGDGTSNRGSGSGHKAKAGHTPDQQRARDNQQYDSLIKQARQMYTEKNYAAAHKKFSDGLAIRTSLGMKQDPIALSNRAACAMMMNRHDEAISDCNKATDVDPQYSPAYLRCARAYLALGEVQSARVTAEEAEVAALHADNSKQREAARDFANTVREILKLESRARDNLTLAGYGACLDSLDKASEVHNEAKMSLSGAGLRCRALVGLRKYAEAAAFASSKVPPQVEGTNDFLACRPRPSGTALSTAVLYAHAVWCTEDPDRAQRILSSVLRVNPSHAAASSLLQRISRYEALRKQGNERYRVGDYRSAITAYDAAIIQAAPRTGDFVNDSGAVELQSGADFEIGAGDCLPAKANILTNRAAARMALGEYQAAVDDCTVALTDSPRHLKARLRRARAYVAQSSWDVAAVDFRSVLPIVREGQADVPTGGRLSEVDSVAIQKELDGCLKAQRAEAEEKAKREREAAAAAARRRAQQQQQRSGGRGNRFDADGYDFEDYDEDHDGDEYEEEDDDEGADAYFHFFGRGGGGGYGNTPGSGSSWKGGSSRQSKPPPKPVYVPPAPPPQPKDYYLILGITASATELEIKKAYKVKALETHPDKSGDGGEKFKEVGEAYETLSDGAKRAVHDKETADWRRRWGHTLKQGKR